MARSLFAFLQVVLDEFRYVGVGGDFHVVAQVHHALVQVRVHPQGYCSAVAIIASSTALRSLPIGRLLGVLWVGHGFFFCIVKGSSHKSKPTCLLAKSGTSRQLSRAKVTKTSARKLTFYRDYLCTSPFRCGDTVRSPALSAVIAVARSCCRIVSTALVLSCLAATALAATALSLV